MPWTISALRAADDQAQVQADYQVGCDRSESVTYQGGRDSGAWLRAN